MHIDGRVGCPPPGFLQWHEVALQWPKCTQCSAQHQQQAQQCVQGTYCGAWRRFACLDAKTRVLAVGALASTSGNNFIADLLFLSEVPHPLLVAGAPCVHPHPLFGEMGNGPCDLTPASADLWSAVCGLLLALLAYLLAAGAGLKFGLWPQASGLWPLASRLLFGVRRPAPSCPGSGERGGQTQTQALGPTNYQVEVEVESPAPSSQLGAWRGVGSELAF
jgi:hypothetical protein